MRPDHSTFEIIRLFARIMRHSVVATPPRQECELSCWVPARRYGFNTCAESLESPCPHISIHLPLGLDNCQALLSLPARRVCDILPSAR